jgi:hypothetical protein
MLLNCTIVSVAVHLAYSLSENSSFAEFQCSMESVEQAIGRGWVGEWVGMCDTECKGVCVNGLITVAV